MIEYIIVIVLYILFFLTSQLSRVRNGFYIFITMITRPLQAPNKYLFFIVVEM